MHSDTFPSSNLGVPDSTLPRIVIVGGGFGGIQAARKLRNKAVQVVLIDKNNYYQFQPLFYQVAMSGIEPSSVVFPFRKVFNKSKNVHIRTTEALEIDNFNQLLITASGNIKYDHLLLSMGTATNHFGNKAIEDNTIGMKSVSESVYLRNCILEMLEETVIGKRNSDSMNIAIIGGGPTGVELSGALSEMKKHVFPKDYPELDFSKMKIMLFEGSGRLLAGMNEKSSNRALLYLQKMGAEVRLNTLISTADEENLYFTDGTKMPFGLIIWSAGVKPVSLKGVPPNSILPNGRIITDSYLKIADAGNIYCIGDQAMVEDKNWPKGHPQMAQAAIQQGELFAKNILNYYRKKELKPFKFKDLGTMATVGRNKAVVEIGGFKIGGFLAWMMWMGVHLMAILGVKNKLFIFINWLWSYITYDQSLRLLIKPFSKKTN